MSTDPNSRNVVRLVALGTIPAAHQTASSAYVPSELRKQIATRSEQFLEEAVRLRSRAAYPKLPRRVLEPLEAAWPTIESTHFDLLDRATALDATEAELKTENDRIMERQAEIDGVTHGHNQTITDWNRDCAGERPEPVYSQCVKRWADLEPILNTHREAIEAHNLEVIAFRDRVQAFTTAVSGLNETLHEWLRRVVDLINAIRAFLAAAPGTMVCSWTERRIPPKNGACIYDCFEPDGKGGWIKHPGIAIPAQTEGDPCPMRLDFVPVPPGV